MQQLVPTLASGAVLGFAGSLHCACMCGSIASGALFMLPADPAARLQGLASAQAGRISVYAVLGAASATVATVALSSGASETGEQLLRWLGSSVLIAAGMSTAGILPPLALAGTLSKLAFLSSPMSSAHSGKHLMTASGMGVAWGFMPCPLVYAALFTASLAGPAAYGAVFMFGFGLGTLPAVLATAMGVSSIGRLRRSKIARVAGGAAIAAVGASLWQFDLHAIASICLAR